ncbi:MAG: biotin/lipoyl attachment protein [Proteobacteria bacterium]|nr:biotin/lipoyl attachment protein [Pseudomonadota bacterium]
MSRNFKITVNGTEYDVAVEELTDGATQIMPRYTPAPVAAVSAAPAAIAVPKAAPAAGGGAQVAQMGGVVTQILVKAGQSVNEGDKIAELEAMKMKVPVTATCSGTVSAIHVAVGDAVEGGQALLTIA